VDPNTATILAKSSNLFFTGGDGVPDILGQWTYLIDGDDIVFGHCNPTGGRVVIARYHVSSNSFTTVGFTGDRLNGLAPASSSSPTSGYYPVNNIVRARDHSGFYVSAGNNLVFVSKTLATTVVASFAPGANISSIHRVYDGSLIFQLDNTLVRLLPATGAVVWQVPLPASYNDPAGNSLDFYGTHDADRLTGPYIGWLTWGGIFGTSTVSLLRVTDGHVRAFTTTGAGIFTGYVTFDSVNLAFIQTDNLGTSPSYTYLVPV
jgi:hypothetical protein